MHYSHKKLYLSLLTSVLLTACNDGADNNSSNHGLLQQFADNRGDSKEIMTPAVLKQNINSQFGSANNEPVAVNANNTVPSLIQR